MTNRQHDVIIVLMITMLAILFGLIVGLAIKYHVVLIDDKRQLPCIIKCLSDITVFPKDEDAISGTCSTEKGHPNKSQFTNQEQEPSEVRQKTWSVGPAQLSAT